MTWRTASKRSPVSKPKKLYFLKTKDCYYDGSKGGVSAVAAKETYLIDILFSDIEDLDNADTILLAGCKTTFMEVAKTYMLRWWAPSINPKDAAIFGIDEHKEKERRDE